MTYSGTYAPQNQSDTNISIFAKDKSNITSILNIQGDREGKGFRNGIILGAACIAAGVVLGAAVSKMGASSEKEEELRSNPSKFYTPVLVAALVV